MRLVNKNGASIYLALLASLVLTSAANAQYTKERNPWPVTIEGVSVAIPFWGGINNPKPALVDFDGDGLLDLMIGEKRGKVAYFKNVGSANFPNWVPQTERIGGINSGTWFVFADIDADGDPDFFCDNRVGGTAFYRNNSIGAQIILTLENSNFGDPSHGGFQTGSSNTPAFADIDGDGDFDFFVGNQIGGVVFYENFGDELDPFFIFRTFSYDDVLAFPTGGPTPPSEEAVQHGNSALVFADLDNDTDLDLFYGDSFNPSIWYFQNFGDIAISDLNFVSQSFFPISNGGFNHATFGDVDGNNSLEIVVGPAGSGKIDNLILIENTTFPDSVTLVVQDLNIIKDIDIGSNSMPAFGDLDGDGDQDLLLGGENGRLAYFKNVGSPSTPAFTLITDTFASITTMRNTSPELVDWDSDGDLDILLGTIEVILQRPRSTVDFWENVGTSASFTFINRGPLINLRDLSGTIDDVPIPRAVDLNSDGKLDLIVGGWDTNGFGNVVIYRNTGTNKVPVLEVETPKLFPRKFGPINIPLVHDWDGDGRKDLIIGVDNIGLTLYRNTAPLGTFPDSLTLIAQTTVLPGADDGAWLSMRLVDIDNDGDLDVFVGEQDGGLNFYRHDNLAVARGDVDGLTGVNQADIMYLINFVILNGPAPQPNAVAADVNCSSSIDLADIVYLIAFLFNSGQAPCTN